MVIYGICHGILLDFIVIMRDLMVIIRDVMVIMWDLMVLIGIHGELCSDFMWICHGELTKNTGILIGYNDDFVIKHGPDLIILIEHLEI